jgi:hypothetical protein
MVLSAFLLVLLGTALCLAAFRASLGLLGLGATETMVWLGLAEVPAPAVSRRRRA